MNGSSNDSPAVSRSLMVCGVPRSGTTLLCNVLRTTGLAGRPVEYLDAGKMRAFAQKWGTSSLEQYVEAMLTRTTTPNGVFAIKAHFGQLRDAIGERDPRDLFPGLRFVYVRRRDRIRQAVSWARAAQTGEWSSRHAAKRGPPRFDANEIRFRLERIEEAERLWEGFFAAKGVSPLRLVYEDFARALEPTVLEVLAYAGIELPHGFRAPAPIDEVQTDELSEDWVRRYRALAQAEVEG